MMESGTEFFDPVHLKTEAYADSRKFRARTGIYRYQDPDIDFRRWAVSHLPEQLGAVLDVGCGPASYLKILAETRRARSLVGMDLSVGILSEIRLTDAQLCVADAQSVPFDDASFDTVLCMHMLYHVPDIDLAIRELRRTARPGGVVLIATNGADHHRRIRDAFDTAVADLSGREVESVLSSPRRFRLEEGREMLQVHFASVERHDLPRELLIPELDPIVEYIESVRSFHESKLPPGVGWNDVVTKFSERVQTEIDRTRAFRTSIHAGVFVCR